MLGRLVGCCLVGFAGFVAATSLHPGGPSNAAAFPVANASTNARAVVVQVVDGDTLVVRLGARSERIRVLGIDAPEMRPRERCAVEATRAVRRLAQGSPAPCGEERPVLRSRGLSAGWARSASGARLVLQLLGL